VGGFSAHGGQSELAAFARPMLEGGAELALVHGEPEKRAALAQRLSAAARAGIRLPMPGSSVVLSARGRGAWDA
jgi:predicted metal-dependent RNase